MASMRSRSRLSGWRWPMAGARPGSVTSTAPLGGRACGRGLDALRSRTRSMCSLAALASWPSRGRSSAGAVPSDLSSTDTRPPFRDRYLSRRARRSASVPALARSCSNCWRRDSRARIGSDIPLRRARICAGCGVGVRGGLRELRERRRARHGEIGELLAVDRVARGLQAGDQLAVGQAVLARRGVDAHHPEPAEVALLAAPADERVLERGVDRLFR